MRSAVFDSPVGPLTVSEDDGSVVRVRFGGHGGNDESALLAAVGEQLYGYFYCELEAFDLPLDPGGTDFQRAVWTAMRSIPRGRTWTYGGLARAIGRPGGARAVGAACGANPIPVLIPCHRVLGSGHIGGYSGGDGLATKRALLALEGASADSDPGPLFQHA